MQTCRKRLGWLPRVLHLDVTVGLCLTRPSLTFLCQRFEHLLTLRDLVYGKHYRIALRWLSQWKVPLHLVHGLNLITDEISSRRIEDIRWFVLVPSVAEWWLSRRFRHGAKLP